MRSSYLSYEYSDTGCCSSDQDQGSDLATSSNVPGSWGLRALQMLIDSVIFERCNQIPGACISEVKLLRWLQSDRANSVLFPHMHALSFKETERASIVASVVIDGAGQVVWLDKCMIDRPEIRQDPIGAWNGIESNPLEQCDFGGDVGYRSAPSPRRRPITPSGYRGLPTRSVNLSPEQALSICSPRGRMDGSAESEFNR
ncbi:hypothetical protein BJV74DRAFT_902488 [Russula compacta]|nr:hypothetical protein BJV74DRAFT_902488 [Russula compacta]